MLTLIFLGLLGLVIWCLRSMKKYNRKALEYSKEVWSDYNHKYGSDDYQDYLVSIYGAVTFGVMAACALIGIFIHMNTLVGFNTIDEKISIYTDQNLKINSALATMVTEYKGYEQDTYTQLKLEDASVLITQIYPELQASELVRTQINTFTENEKQLTELRLKKSERAITLWWLTFGIGG